MPAAQAAGVGAVNLLEIGVNASRRRVDQLYERITKRGDQLIVLTERQQCFRCGVVQLRERLFARVLNREADTRERINQVF